MKIEISFCGVLGIVFVALKLIGIISCNWLWVLAPLWIPLAIVLVCSTIAGFAEIMLKVIEIIEKGDKRK